MGWFGLPAGLGEEADIQWSGILGVVWCSQARRPSVPRTGLKKVGGLADKSKGEEVCHGGSVYGKKDRNAAAGKGREASGAETFSVIRSSIGPKLRAERATSTSDSAPPNMHDIGGSPGTFSNADDYVRRYTTSICAEETLVAWWGNSKDVACPHEFSISKTLEISLFADGAPFLTAQPVQCLSPCNQRSRDP